MSVFAVLFPWLAVEDPRTVQCQCLLCCSHFSQWLAVEDPRAVQCKCLLCCSCFSQWLAVEDLRTVHYQCLLCCSCFSQWLAVEDLRTVHYQCLLCCSRFSQWLAVEDPRAVQCQCLLCCSRFSQWLAVLLYYLTRGMLHVMSIHCVAWDLLRIMQWPLERMSPGQFRAQRGDCRKCQIRPFNVSIVLFVLRSPAISLGFTTFG